MAKTFYVYIYLDPRKPGMHVYGGHTFRYEPFYIGKGMTGSGRIDDHLINRRVDEEHNPHKYRKIRRILGEGIKPIRYKILSDVSEDEAFELEVSLISNIGRYNLKEGPLTNLTAGGDGCAGLKWSDEAKQRSSEMRKGRKYSEAHRAAIGRGSRGRTHSKESRKKISIGVTGNKNGMYGKRGDQSPLYGRKIPKEVIEKRLKTIREKRNG